MSRTGRRHRVPALLLSIVTFGILVVVGNLLVMSVIGPALLRTTDLARLKPTLLDIVLMTYGSSFIAALLAGIAGGRQGLRRGSVSRTGNLVGAALGPLLFAGVLVAYAALTKQAVVPRATEINFALIITGALLGCLIAELRGPSRPVVARISGPPLTPRTFVASVSMFVTLGGPPAAGMTTMMPHNSADSRVSAFDFEPQDCVTQSHELSIDIALTAFSISLGPHFAYEESRTADGNWEAAATSGYLGGLKVILGEHVAASLLRGTKFQEGLSFELDADGLLTKVNKYELSSEVATQNLVKWEALQNLDSVVVLPGVADLIGQAVTPDTVSAPARIPKETDVELAGDLKLSVQAGTGVGFQADVRLGSKSGLKLVGANPQIQPMNDPKEIDLYVGLSGEVDGNVTAQLLALFGHGASDLVLTMAIEPASDLRQVWVPSKLTLEASGTASFGAGLALSNDSPDAWLKGFKLIPSTGGRLQVSDGLNLVPNPQHPEDVAVFTNFFAALEPVLAGNPTSAQRASLEQATQAFVGVLARDATSRAALYDTSGGNLSVDVAVGDVIAMGASSEIELTTENLVGARFLDQTGSWVNSQSCKV